MTRGGPLVGLAACILVACARPLLGPASDDDGDDASTDDGATDPATSSSEGSSSDGGDPTPACHGSYDPCLPVVDDLDCADVIAMGSAPVAVLGPDEYGLDADGDGWGCET